MKDGVQVRVHDYQVSFNKSRSWLVPIDWGSCSHIQILLLYFFFSAVLCAVIMEAVHVGVACLRSEDAVLAVVSAEDPTVVNKKMIHINYQATKIKQKISQFKEFNKMCLACLK